MPPVSTVASVQADPSARFVDRLVNDALLAAALKLKAKAEREGGPIPRNSEIVEFAKVVLAAAAARLTEPGFMQAYFGTPGIETA